MTYKVGCRSKISGMESYCKKEGEEIEFETKEEAEAYAEEARDRMGINYHYWVEETVSGW